ncbi:MAG: hypothetical protein IBJ12_08880 [Sphingomonadaceae bacterium]|nr:hypothetical protein [Sphingomonadaceae bacterium]
MDMQSGYPSTHGAQPQNGAVQHNHAKVAKFTSGAILAVPFEEFMLEIATR